MAVEEGGSCGNRDSLIRGANSTTALMCVCVLGLCVTHSYDEALQALADSEAKRETADKELSIVSPS